MSAKRKAATIAAPVVKPSAKTRSKTQIDETRTVVSTGFSSKDEPIEVSSDPPSGAEDKEEQADEEVVDQEQITAAATEDEEMGGDASDTEPAAPTFGELLRGSATVDVSASLAAQTSGAASSARLEAQQRNAGLINTNSFATLLNQALRTSDNLLLETCLEETNIKAVENTIARLDSALALELLSKLAARLHRRPGRSLTLMQWMKLTMIAHGGALVNRPDLTARLGELSRVLEERARGLPALLALRGKLEMLDAQLKFRKAVKQASANRDRVTGEDESDEEDEEDEDEPQVVYIEGQETTKGLLTNGASKTVAADDEDDFPIGHDVLADSDDDEEEEEEDFEGEEEERLADAESLDEDEVDHDDVDDEEDDSEGEDAGPPAKMQRTLRPRK